MKELYNYIKGWVLYLISIPIKKYRYEKLYDGMLHDKEIHVIKAQEDLKSKPLGANYADILENITEGSIVNLYDKSDKDITEGGGGGSGGSGKIIFLNANDNKENGENNEKR